MHGEGLPAWAAEQLLGGFCLAFFFFPLPLLAGSVLCISNSNRLTQVIIQLPLGLAPAQLGHISDTWHHTRREGGRQRGSIPSAPKANKLHRLTLVATETCTTDLGFSRSLEDKLHTFLPFGIWFDIPLYLLPQGQLWGKVLFALSLRRLRPNPSKEHRGARGPRPLPAPAARITAQRR